MVREPCVAGMFYPGSRKSLEQELEKLIAHSEAKKKVKGLISPHAGYMYSGSCAGKGYGYIRVPDSVVIIGVNHRGYGHPFSIDGHDYWRTPLGDCAVDAELRSRMVKDSNIFAIDSKAGIEEHSLEVQVPFIQVINPKARILPITVSSGDIDLLVNAGRDLANCLKDEKEVLMVASTDMSHYIDAESAYTEDHKAIDKIVHLDPEGLFETVVSQGISMCGVSSTVIMLKAAIENGATESEVVEYTHSGMVSGDFHQVVAYLSLVVF